MVGAAIALHAPHAPLCVQADLAQQLRALELGLAGALGLTFSDKHTISKLPVSGEMELNVSISRRPGKHASSCLHNPLSRVQWQ